MENKQAPQVRYSDEDLEEFKTLILEKLEQANASLENLKANLSGGEHSTDDTAPTFKILEEGYAVAEKEENARLVSRTRPTACAAKPANSSQRKDCAACPSPHAAWTLN